MSIAAFLGQNGISQAEVAEALAVTAGAISHKLAGRRGWAKREIDTLLVFLASRLGRVVTYEEAFAPPAESDLVGRERAS